MSKPRLDLMSGYSLFNTEVASDNQTSITIKGFVSVEVEDRQGQVAIADAFLIDRYLNAPTVLAEHKYWIDDNGNKVPVGKAERLYSVVIEAHPEDKDLVRVRDRKSMTIVSDFPKSKIPEVPIGTKGLFTFITITEPDVVDRVRKGQYSAFSWTGWAQRGYRLNTKSQEVEEVLTRIDLAEISVVTMPINHAAGFIASKAVCELTFNKGRFKSKGEVTGYLVDRELPFDEIKETSRSYVCTLLKSEVVRKSLTNLTLESPDDGVAAIVGDVSDSSEWGTHQKGTTEMTEQTPEVTTTPAANDDFISLKTGLEKFALEVKGMIAEIPETIKQIRTEFDTFKTDFSTLKGTVETLQKSITPPAETPAADTTKPADEKVASLESKVEEISKGLIKFNETFAALMKTPQATAPREEKITKSQPEKEDPNACFDNIFSVFGSPAA